jgi:hypothetical protein
MRRRRAKERAENPPEPRQCLSPEEVARRTRERNRIYEARPEIKERRRKQRLSRLSVPGALATWKRRMHEYKSTPEVQDRRRELKAEKRLRKQSDNQGATP